MSNICLQGMIRGAVQGVGFRRAAVREATRLGVDGWVRNDGDGAVSVLLCGSEDAVEAMATWLQQGPARARVEQVALNACVWQDIAGFVQL